MGRCAGVASGSGLREWSIRARSAGLPTVFALHELGAHMSRMSRTSRPDSKASRLLVHDFMESACRLSLRAAAHSGAGSFLSPVSGPSGLDPAFDDLHRGAGTLSRALAPKRRTHLFLFRNSAMQRLGVNSSLTAVGRELIAPDTPILQFLQSITAA